MHVHNRIRYYTYVQVTVEIQDKSAEYSHDPKTNKVNGQMKCICVLLQILYFLIQRKLSTNISCLSTPDYLDGWEDRFEIPWK